MVVAGSCRRSPTNNGFDQTGFGLVCELIIDSRSVNPGRYANGVIGVQISLAAIPNAVETRERLPHPNWPIVFDWVENNVAIDDINNAWVKLASDWLDALLASLPEGYGRTESPEFILLSNGDARSARRILDRCESARRIILDTLSGVACDDGYGKHVVLAFGDPDTYYDYIADFYPDEGEFALSGGIFLDCGYGHFAMCLACSGDHDRTIAHELNHALLRHLPLPLWLNEGVTQVIEDMVVGNSEFVVDHDTRRRHRSYWNRDTIDLFWSGASFYSPDVGQELSYHLAQILFRNLMSDYPKKINDFLNSASFADAGNAALVKLCGVSIGDCVKQFLGEGDWSPRSDYAGFVVKQCRVP